MNEQIILALMPYVVPSLIGLCVYIYHQVFQALPEKQREALEQLAAPAVQMVEQMYANIPPDQKKAAAIHAIELGFQAFKIPAPDDAIINAFIEAAVFEMNRLKPSTNTQQIPTLRGGSIAIDLTQKKGN
jgi:LL-H family phage holin